MIRIIICWSLRLIWSLFSEKNSRSSLAFTHSLSDRLTEKAFFTVWTVINMTLCPFPLFDRLPEQLPGFISFACDEKNLVLPSLLFPSLLTAINQWWHRASFFLSSQFQVSLLFFMRVCASTDSRCSLIIHSCISCLLKSFFLWMVSVSLMLHPHLNFLLLGKERNILRVIALLVLDSEFDLLLFSWEWQVKYKSPVVVAETEKRKNITLTEDKSHSSVTFYRVYRQCLSTFSCIPLLLLCKNLARSFPSFFSIENIGFLIIFVYDSQPLHLFSWLPLKTRY